MENDQQASLSEQYFLKKRSTLRLPNFQKTSSELSLAFI